jgi:biotin transporter BioY
MFDPKNAATFEKPFTAAEQNNQRFMKAIIWVFIGILLFCLAGVVVLAWRYNINLERSIAPSIDQWPFLTADCYCLLPIACRDALPHL